MSNKLPSTKFGLAIAIGVFSGIGISNLWNHFRRFIPIGRKFSSILSQTPPKKSKIYTRTGDAGTSSVILLLYLIDNQLLMSHLFTF
jgi:hypothetical protein